MDMLIPELFSPSLALQPQTAGSTVRAWTAGQILEATVVRQALDGTVTLRVGNQELQARTGLNLSADQSLTLQVAQSGTQTVLRIMHVSDTPPLSQPTTPAHTPVGTPAANTPEATLAQAWRQVLPREGDLRPLLAQLAGSRPEALPEPVAAALKQFAARLPLLETLLTPAGLKRAVRDSGLFMEAHLAQAVTNNTAPAMQNDLKANLLQLIVRLQSLAKPAPAATPGVVNEPATNIPVDPALPILLRQADTALARIEQNQLATLTGSPHAATLLAVDLPVREQQHSSVLELSIEEQAPGASTPEAVMPWSVWLHFEFEQLGKVHARVTLRNDEVSAMLWAEHETTTALFQQHAPTLETALRQAGLVSAEVHCQTGAPPHAGEAAHSNSLLDIRV